MIILLQYSKEVRNHACKKTSKNQLTLPKDIVKSFPGSDYFDVSVEGGKIVLMPVKIKLADAGRAGIRDKMAKLGITEDDVTEAVAWARKKEVDKTSPTLLYFHP